MRTIELTIDKADLRSKTTAILKGENRLVLSPADIDASGLYLILQDSFGVRKRVALHDHTTKKLVENVKQFSSFWFECASLNAAGKIEVELK